MVVDVNEPLPVRVPVIDRVAVWLVVRVTEGLKEPVPERVPVRVCDIVPVPVPVRVPVFEGVHVEVPV